MGEIRIITKEDSLVEKLLNSLRKEYIIKIHHVEFRNGVNCGITKVMIEMEKIPER